MINSLPQKIVSKVKLSTMHINLNKKLENTVLLVGSGRSGTTWMSNIVNYNNQYRYIFEPFFPQKVNEVRKFKGRLYLPPESDGGRYAQTIYDVLSGEVNNPWINSLNKRLISSKRLVKSIRANLFVNWIHTHCPEAKLMADT